MTDSLAEAWQLEPDDLVKGFLRVPFPDAEGTRHAYDNPTTFVLARMVERVTGRGLPELLDERLFKPMGVDHAEWDRVASGAAFGFHGLHLTTEAVAAFGELLLRGGRWGDRQLVPREWVELATRRHIETLPFEDGSDECRLPLRLRLPVLDVASRLPRSRRLRPAVRGRPVARSRGRRDRRQGEAQDVLDAVWECLLPGLDHAGSARDDEILADRLRQLSLAPVPGSAAPERSVKARLDASAEDSALPDGTTVIVDPVDRRVAPATRVVPRRRGRPRRMAGKLTARPPRRRGRRLAGQHVRRRPLRHHHPAPGPAGGRRRRGDSGRDVEHRAPDRPRVWRCICGRR